LIDTGGNKYSWTQEPETFGPKLGGKLQTSLKAAGYTPNEIDAILTHIHTDHSGGWSKWSTVFPRHALSASQMSISGSIERMPRDSTLLKSTLTKPRKLSNLI